LPPRVEIGSREKKGGEAFGAMNLSFANDRTRLVASDGLQHESLLGAGAALAAQVMPGLWLGGGARYLRDYSGAALNVFAGQALYIGPTVYARLAGNTFVSAAWEFQMWGEATGAPGALDLTNFERYRLKLRLGWSFERSRRAKEIRTCMRCICPASLSAGRVRGRSGGLRSRGEPKVGTDPCVSGAGKRDGWPARFSPVRDERSVA